MLIGGMGADWGLYQPLMRLTAQKGQMKGLSRPVVHLLLHRCLLPSIFTSLQLCGSAVTHVQPHNMPAALPTTERC